MKDNMQTSQHMPKITILLPKQIASEAKINIYIDGRKAGPVGVGEIVQFEVSPNKHKVEAKCKWGGESKPVIVDLSDDRNKTLKMSKHKYAFLIPFVIGALVAVVYSFLKSYFNIQPSWLVNIIVFVILSLGLFHLLGKKYYWKLEEVEVVQSKKKTKAEQASLITKIMTKEERDRLYGV